jgi:hypothetical protein
LKAHNNIKEVFVNSVYESKLSEAIGGNKFAMAHYLLSLSQILWTFSEDVTF